MKVLVSSKEVDIVIRDCASSGTLNLLYYLNRATCEHTSGKLLLSY